MIRFLCLIALLSGRANSFLRLCAQDASIDSTLIPDCVARAPRQEIRDLTDEERTRVVEAFRRERAVAPRQQWETILDPPGVYQLIERLDTRLRSRHLSLPYWDTSLELRHNQPRDSIVFHPSFLLRSRRRRDRRPLVRPKTRFERRNRNPRDDKTTRRLLSQRTRKLLKAIRRDRQSELLFLLFEMGDLFTRISTPLVCPSSSPYISCTLNSSLPLSKLSPSTRCSDTLPEDICYHSECISDVCTVVMESLIPIVPLSTVISTTSEPETSQNASNETDNSTHVDLSSVDGVSTLSDEVFQLLSFHEIITSTPPVPINRHNQNGWYRYNPIKDTMDPPRKREKVVRQAPINSDEDAASPSIVIAHAGKIKQRRSIDQSVLKKRGAHDSKHVEARRNTFNYNLSHPIQMESVSPSQSPSQFPEVFIPITVIEGPWRGPHRMRQATNITATVQGLNSPIGFTVTTQALEVKSSVGLFIVKVPDPEFAGPLVEFNVSVTSKANKKCEQFCLSKNSAPPAAGSYKPCIRSSIRLSKYGDFSDPVQWHKSETTAITSEWIGTGYYRRRRLTPLLFSCNSYSE